MNWKNIISPCLRQVLASVQILSMVLPAAAAAAVREKTDTLSLEECIFTVRRPEREVLPAQTLDGKQLETLSAHSVADAARYFSGIQIKDYGGIGGLKTVNVRSMGSHHTGVFYDGIELGNAQNGVIDLGRFSLDNMEAVTLYTGQKSSLLQPARDYASASSIYLRTRRPVFGQENKDAGGKGKNWNLDIGLKAGSFKTANPSLLWEQKISDRISSSLSAEYLYTSGEYKFRYATAGGYDTTAVRKNGDISMARVEAAFFGQMNEGEWDAKVYFYNSERGYPGAAVREVPGLFINQDRQWDTNVMVQSSFMKRFVPFYSLMVKGKYAWNRLRYRSDPELDVSAMFCDNCFLQQEVYLSHSHLFEILPVWSVSMASDLQYNHLDSDMKNFAYPRRMSVETALATSLDFDSVKLQASLLHTYIHDRTGGKKMTGLQGQAPEDRNAFSPSVILSAKPFAAHDFRLRAFFRETYRMPTLNDLYYTEIGNAALDPEKARQYNLGLTWNKKFKSWFRSIDLQADGYFNQIHDKIIATPTSNQFRWTMLNLGYVEIWGADAAIQSNFIFGKVEISPRITYTWQRARDLTDPESEWYGGQIPYVPVHSCSAILNVCWKGWSLNYSFIYTGERYESVANIPENHAQPWYTHDLSLSKLFRFRKFSLRASAQVNNIFNQRYEIVQRYPMPGTNFNLKVNFII